MSDINYNYIKIIPAAMDAMANILFLDSSLRISSMAKIFSSVKNYKKDFYILITKLNIS